MALASNSYHLHIGKFLSKELGLLKTHFVHQFEDIYIIFFGTSLSLAVKLGCLIKVKPVLNWANVCSPEHTSDTSTNYDSFLN